QRRRTMPTIHRQLTWLAAAVSLLTVSPLAQEHQHATSQEKLGTVHFETSCAAAAQPQFDRAMALLHSFEFGQAIQGFTSALEADPGCSIGHWGIALARWGNPFAAVIRPPAQLQQGLDAITAAQKTPPKTERERGYVGAAAKLYVDFDKLDQRARVVSYSQAMADLSA